MERGDRVKEAIPGIQQQIEREQEAIRLAEDEAEHQRNGDALALDETWPRFSDDNQTLAPWNEHVRPWRTLRDACCRIGRMTVIGRAPDFSCWHMIDAEAVRNSRSCELGGKLFVINRETHSASYEFRYGTATFVHILPNPDSLGYELPQDAILGRFLLGGLEVQPVAFQVKIIFGIDKTERNSDFTWEIGAWLKMVKFSNIPKLPDFMTISAFNDDGWNKFFVALCETLQRVPHVNPIYFHQPQCYEDARKLAISWLIMAGKHYGFTERIDQDDVEFVPTFLKEQYWEDDFNDDQQWSMYQSEAR